MLGKGDNDEAIKDLIRMTPCRVGGGIRDVETAVAWLDERGLIDYVTVGNVPGHALNSTFCPNCSEVLIQRIHFQVVANNIENGHLGGAATDVLTKEPPPADHPLLAYRHPRLIVTPHIAWASIEARQRLLDQVALNISEYLAGRTRNRVN